MALRITFTGRPIVAGETDRTITFTDMGLEWAAAGYDIYLTVTDTLDIEHHYLLDAVIGQADQAKLSSTSGVFPLEGVYKLKLRATTAGITELKSVDYYLYVYP